MAVSASTPANLVVGAGDILVDDASQGATADDNTFRIEQTIFEPDNLNGVPGMLVGTQYKTREEAILEVTMPEVAAATLALLWPGSAAATVGDVTTIDWDGTRRIPSASFHDYELRVPGLDGRIFGFLADNAVNQGNIEYTAQDAGLMLPRGEFHSKWDAGSLNASPHRIEVTAGSSGS
jgi:hypothetical protein